LGDDTAKWPSAGKGLKRVEKGQIRVDFARFSSFFRRDFCKFVLMIKELSALCTKRSASFFVFHTKQAEKSEHKEMDPRVDSRQPRIASSCENRVRGRPGERSWFEYAPERRNYRQMEVDLDAGTCGLLGLTSGSGAGVSSGGGLVETGRG
jgi:hypothetical protein